MSLPHTWQDGDILTAEDMNELEAEVMTAIQSDATITTSEIDELFIEESNN